MDAAPHAPVLLNEVLEAVAPKNGEVIVDATFGAGGYSAALLRHAECHVIAVDRDPSVRPHADRVRAEFPDRFTFLQERFGELPALLQGQQVDALVLDIGVSSMQLDTPERGFSFRFDAPLDMRMSDTGSSAADLLASLSEKEISDILWRYGEEKASRRIAALIVNMREEIPITTTQQLKALVHQVIPPYGGKMDPATRTFQALRIAVNDELQELERVLAASVVMLREGGRLVVVTFHSLEDRRVKQFMRTHATVAVAPSRHMPSLPDASHHAPLFRVNHNKAVIAGEAEIALNPRARSAKLRSCTRTSVPHQGAV
jgi:16S rRNA (cytosine1402-N4)-methyltransferase